MTRSQRSKIYEKKPDDLQIFILKLVKKMQSDLRVI